VNVRLCPEANDQSARSKWHQEQEASHSHRPRLHLREELCELRELEPRDNQGNGFVRDPRSEEAYESDHDG